MKDSKRDEAAEESRFEKYFSEGNGENKAVEDEVQEQEPKEPRRKFLKALGAGTASLGALSVAGGVAAFRLEPEKLSTETGREILKKDAGEASADLDTIETNILDTSELTSDSAVIEQDLNAEEIIAEQVDSEFIDSDEVETGELTTGDLDADLINADVADTEEVDSEFVDATQVESSEIEADEVQTEELDTDQLNSADLEQASDGQAPLSDGDGSLEMRNPRTDSDQPLSVEVRTDDPDDPDTGNIWLRTDL